MKAKKRRERLANRQADFDKMIREGKADDYKGFKRPGSVKK